MSVLPRFLVPLAIFLSLLPSVMAQGSNCPGKAALLLIPKHGIGLIISLAASQMLPLRRANQPRHAKTAIHGTSTKVAALPLLPPDHKAALMTSFGISPKTPAFRKAGHPIAHSLP
ncbi:hypothetical protein F5148DRAFT_1151840 [Russula earlei]|uniref:Uncharacterized protein n=1 Tax=Russula earlei TaxID=71964 RepID=A0ACC0TZN2_9AGAM|nr:hypothetical protein F5148DRAFT_1151840 [Russula earlei]